MIATTREPLLAKIRGEGIEIGALDAPIELADATVRYVDVLTREECLRHYPELPHHDRVIEPDIIAAADDLSVIDDASQDFILASHLLEHMADPIGTLVGFRRVLKPGGLLFLVLPDKRHTFDRPRERTTLDHLIADHREPPGHPARDRRDFDAYRDWARISKSFARDDQIDFWAEMLQRARYNVHFHCWIPEDVHELFAWLRESGTAPFELVEEARPKDGWEFAMLMRRVDG